MKIRDKKMFDIDSMYLMMKEFKFDDKSGKFSTVKPDINKDVKDLSKEQRNNLLIDIIRGVLSHSDTASKQINPGNFDSLKATARRLNILASGSNYTWQQLKGMSLDELDKISNKEQLDILDYPTQIALHKQNMTAAKLIGIIANHSTNHAVRQNTKIEVSPVYNKIKGEDGVSRTVTYDRFKLNGKFLTSLHDIINPGGTAYISKNYASFLAASVDAVKDPVLSFFNLNTFTADSAMLLTGLGYSFDETGLLLRQPVVEELVQYFDRGSKSGVTKTSAVSDLLDKYKSFLNNTLNTPVYSDLFEINSNAFTSERMAKMIGLGNELKELNLLEGKAKDEFIHKNYGDIQDFYKYQYQVLLNYSNILDTAQKLADFIAASKADTGNGGAGPTIADTKFKLRSLEKHIKNSNPENGVPVLLNAEVIEFVEPEVLNDETSLREFLRESPLGFIQGFTTLGLQGTQQVMSQYFPHYNTYFDYIFDKLEEDMLKSGRLSVDMMNQIYTEFFAYYMSQFEGFTWKGSNKFIRSFPKTFLDMKNSNEELKDLQIIKNIQYINPGADVPVAKLKFRAGGKLSSNVRDTMIMEWESLLYQPEYRQLALDLFRYNYFVNGFGFGTASFIHLAPAMVKLEFPEFVNNLYKLIDMTGKDNDVENNRFSEAQLDTFIDQYYRNHLGNRKLVPEMTSIEEASLKNNDNTVKEVIELKLNFKDNNDFFTNNGVVLPYLYKSINDREEYFRITMSELQKDNGVSIILQNIKPLGIKNNFLEYDFGNLGLVSSITLDDYTSINNREEYLQDYADVTMPQDAYNNVYYPEPSGHQEMPEDLVQHFSNAFDFISLENDKFNRDNSQFESLSESDMPSFVREFSQVDNDTFFSNSPNMKEANEALFREVSQKTIEEYKNRCK